MKVSIIIPVFNEAKAIGSVVAELLQFSFPFSFEIITVNDGSTDGSLVELERFNREPRFSVISYARNRGYGAALKEGIRRAGGDYVVTYDGDGQFAPEDVAILVDAVKDGSLAAVFGERKVFVRGSSLWRMPGKMFLRFLIRLLVGINIKDFNCGLRIMHAATIRRYLHLCSNQFSFSMTSMLILVHRGYSYAFQPIVLRKRQGGRSTVRVMSGVNTIYLIIKLIMLFNPLKIFGSVGGVSLLVGLVWGGYYVWQGGGLSVGALLLLLLGVLLIFLGLIADQVAELRKSLFEAYAQ